MPTGSVKTETELESDLTSGIKGVVTSVEKTDAPTLRTIFTNFKRTIFQAIEDLTTAISGKAPIASPTFTGTVSGVTKAMVGLGNVDNTADTNKPISTATQTALDLKANETTVNTITSVQSTRRTGGAPSNYYPLYTATKNIIYIGIDLSDVALKNNSTYIDRWIKLIAPPIATAASSVSSTGFTANWSLDTYWNGTAFVSEAITSYTLQYSTSSTFASGNTTIANLTATSYTITGLTAATTYYYRVLAVNGNDVSNYSSTITQATAAAPTQNEWLASYANNLYLNTSGSISPQHVAVTSTNQGSVDWWCVVNITASTPDASDTLFNLNDTTTAKFRLRSNATFNADIGVTNDALTLDSSLSAGTPMNLAGRFLVTRVGNTLTLYKDNLSTIVRTHTLTTGTGASTFNRLSIGQSQSSGNVWNGAIQKLALYTGALPGTADQMLAAV